MIELRDAVLNPELRLWAWKMVPHLFLVGLAAGLLVFASWVHLTGGRREYLPAARAAALLVPPLLVADLILLWFDLGSRWIAFWLYTTIVPGSPMSWGSWILLAVLLTSSLAAVPALLSTRAGADVLSRAPLLERIARRIDQWVGRRGRTLAWTNVGLGVALGLYPGILLGTMVAHPLLNSPMVAPLLLVSGIATAGAVLLLLAPSGPWVQALTRAGAGVLALTLLLLGLYVLGLATSTGAAQAAAATLVTGPWAWTFWALVVGVGILLPLGMALAEIITHRVSRTVALLSVSMVLAGGLALRVVLIYAG